MTFRTSCGARRGANLATSRWPFIELQTALAIDILLHVPMRMQNLTSLEFNVHLHWPQGRRKPALLTFRGAETKNDEPMEFEIPTVLAERLQVYRNEIAPAVTGERPDRCLRQLRRHPENSSRDLSCDRENSPEASRSEDDLSSVPPPRGQNNFGRQSWGVRTSEAAVGPQKPEDDHQVSTPASTRFGPDVLMPSCSRRSVNLSSAGDASAEHLGRERSSRHGRT